MNTGAEVEKAILGGILLDEKAYDEARSLGLEAQDFVLDSHRKIFSHMEALAATTKPIDIITIIDELNRTRNLIPIGDVGYVSSLIEGLPDRPSIKTYVRIVKEQSAQRKLINACESIKAGFSSAMTSAEAMSYLTDQMLQVQAGTDDDPALRTCQFSDAAYSKWLEVARDSREVIGLATGISSLDYATTGIRPGELWPVGARTGAGKSNLALQIAAANCREGIPVAMFSIEMDKDSLLHRLWSGESGVPFKYIRYPRNLTGQVTAAIEAAMLTVGRWPLFVTENKISLAQLLAKAKLLIRRERVKLVIVDYLQKVSAPGRDERTVVTKVCEGLRDMAKSTGVPIVLLSQFSRPDQSNRNRRPTLYDFKESGSIENDAHVALLIHRPKDEFDRVTGEDEIIIGKQRNGEFSIEKVRLNSTLRFEERP